MAGGEDEEIPVLGDPTEDPDDVWFVRLLVEGVGEPLYAGPWSWNRAVTWHNVLVESGAVKVQRVDYVPAADVVADLLKGRNGE